jgi:hypothetical protein
MGKFQSKQPPCPRRLILVNGLTVVCQGVFSHRITEERMSRMALIKNVTVSVSNDHTPQHTLPSRRQHIFAALGHRL